MSIIPAGISGETPQYQISRSLRFNSADSAYLSRTPSVAGNRRTWTWSGWVKRCEFPINTFHALMSTVDTGGLNLFRAGFYYDANIPRVLLFDMYLNASPSAGGRLYSAVSHSDPSSWYHIVFVYDTTNVTASDRVRLYTNGIRITTFIAGLEFYPALNTEGHVNKNAVEHRIGYDNGYGSIGGYMTEINFIDGQALTPSSFGEFDSVTGVWKPKKYTGTYGTNGFYLNFSDNSATTATTLGKDSSGNNNNWTPNNFSVTAGAGNDSMVDTPTPYGTDTGIGGEVRGNYCTLNTVDTGGATLTNGNLDQTTPSTGYGATRGTIGVSSGKWYWEVTPTSLPVTSGTQLGIAGASAAFTTATQIGALSNGYSYINNGDKYGAVVYTASYAASFVVNDVIGVALDLDGGTLTFYKNGVSQGTAFTGLSGTFHPALSDNSNSAASAFTYNFGQRPFAYTAPSGFKALCTTNLPEPTIKKGSNHFNTVTYTGNGSSLAVTNVGFQPDFLWIKQRGGITSHVLQDVIRGAGKSLFSNANEAELGNTGDLITSFDSNGFTVNDTYLGGSGGGGTNGNSGTYVAWNWKGGGTAVTNAQGTITSQVSANPSAGFSIVTYTGTGANATVGHGLGVIPKFIAVKKRIGNTGSGVSDWCNYHSNQNASPANGGMFFNLQNGFTTTSAYWNNTVPTSNVFSVGTSQYTNESTKTYVAYCFAEIPGYSAFGSYTGNGSTGGPFVYTGFRPRFILLKVTNTTGNWTILDTAREGYNVDNDPLYPNLNNAEGTTDLLDILSNGFKLRTTDASVNGNTNTYIYAAFAENPFKYSLAR